MEMVFGLVMGMVAFVVVSLTEGDPLGWWVALGLVAVGGVVVVVV